MRLRARGRSRPVPGQMNALESDWSLALEWMRIDGDVACYHFEGMKLRLAKRTWYTPDFLVMKRDGLLELHEVKGFMREDAAIKLKVAAEAFPEFKFVLVRRPKKVWVVEEVAP